MHKRYIRSYTNREHICEVTPELVAKLKTYLLLGRTTVTIHSPLVINRVLIARGDYQTDKFKFNAQYQGNDTWLINIWEV